ncbi:MAG: hypothetical protein SF029_13350 [bacterium]|nr:hypothetical protein [bacterium]
MSRIRTLSLTLILALLLALSVAPSLAQEATPSNLPAPVHAVRFDGFGFMLDSTIARNVNISQVEGANVADYAPGFTEPAYTQFGLYNDFPAPQSLFEAHGGLRVYDIAALEGFTEELATVERLQALLNQRPQLVTAVMPDMSSRESWLPFLPVAPHGQVARAKAHYLDNGAVSGIAYLVALQAAREPFTASTFVYTFQGISADGRTYVVGVFPVLASVFPVELEAFNPDEFAAQFNQYLLDSVNALESAEPTAFSPSLDLLDALVLSISIGQG